MQFHSSYMSPSTNVNKHPSNTTKIIHLHAYDCHCSQKCSSILNCSTASQSNNPSGPKLGPMIDDGAPCSAIGKTELLIQARGSATSSNDLICPLPESMSHMKFSQFGSGAHASAAKPIIGSSSIQFCTDYGNTISVRHIVVDGSSP